MRASHFGAACWPKLKQALNDYPDVEKARVKVVYLAPKSTASYFTEAVKEFKRRNPNLVLAEDSTVCFSFDDLAHGATGKEYGDFPRYREMFFKALCKLDLDEKDSTESGKKNYRGRLSLHEVLKNCKADKSILVGFTGGSKALAKQDFAHLENRLFKWDIADDKRVGNKILANWIQAEQFIQIVEPILSGSLRTDADVERLASGVRDALRNNPKLTLGQIVERVSSNAPIPLGELSDDDLVKALKS